MEKTRRYDKLKIYELKIMLSHLRLGKAHLQRMLDKDQFIELLHSINLPTDKANHIKADSVEKLGNFTMTLNTVVTGMVGGQLGTAALFDTGMVSSTVLWAVGALSLLMGGYIGFTNYRVTSAEAKEAMIEQKIHDLQLQLAKQMNMKIQASIAELVESINLLLPNSNSMNSDLMLKAEQVTRIFSSKSLTTFWFYQLNSALKHQANQFNNAQMAKVYLEELKAFKIKIRKTLFGHFHVKKVANKSYLDVLTHPNYTPTEVKISRPSWLRQNFRKLVGGSVPTLIGVFGSMFVYFGTLPRVSREYNLTWLQPWVFNPTVNWIELGVAVAITLYLAFNYVYSNYKSFLRGIELEKTNKLIVQEEANMLEASRVFGIMKRMKVDIGNLFHELNLLRGVNKEMERARV